MKLFYIAFLSAALFSSSLHAERGELAAASSTTKENIRLRSVKATPEPGTAILVVQVPKDGRVLKGNPVWVQARVDGYALGSDSQFDRADEVANSKNGQSLHVIIDNEPYFEVYGSAIDPFNEQGWYYDQFFKFEVPFKLKKGFHTIRIFLARSFGESLKGDKIYFASYFFVGERTEISDMEIFTEPYLTYNEPSNLSRLEEGKPVLLDFYLSNVELSSDGYKVRMTIDGKYKRVLTNWQPYYIYGMTKGKHTVRLELIDSNNKLVPGPFNDTTRTIKVR